MNKEADIKQKNQTVFRTICKILISTMVFTLFFINGSARAGEVGRYFPGVFNIRDFKVDSITIGDTTIDVDVNLNLYSIVPFFVWSTGFKIFGADYAVTVAPTFANASIGAAISLEEHGFDLDDSQYPPH